MSVVCLRFGDLCAICDFDYSKFSDDYGNHVRCELSTSSISVDELADIVNKVLSFLSSNIIKNIYENVSISVRDVVELRIYSKILDHGLSFYDIVEKICLLASYEIWRRIFS
ncbi:MAG: hypothetical protein GXO10_00870 [Crenarchaeota archaeon]|nr:hypothetical protein [Thermoproteota archaeon]